MTTGFALIIGLLGCVYIVAGMSPLPGERANAGLLIAGVVMVTLAATIIRGVWG
jgi:hypothetical protein